MPMLDEMRLRFGLGLGFVFSLATVALAQMSPGRISGTVLGPDGNPVEDAHVSAQVMNDRIGLTGLIEQTDKNGQFAFSTLKLGAYSVYAEKTEAGYLSARPDESGSTQANITLTEQSPTANVIIHFGPKAGILTGWVIDSATGKPIFAHLSLRPADGSSWSTTGTNEKFKFRLLIPANAQVWFGACADGYKLWSYADSSNPNQPIPVTLAPGAELDVNIELDPSGVRTADSCAAGTY